MLSRKSAGWTAVALAAGVAALAMLVRHDRTGARDLGVPPSLPHASAERAPTARQASNRSAPAALVSFAGFPADTVDDPMRRYSFARDCAKFRHFDAFFKERSADPAWPLNSAAALAAADPQRREELLATARFLDRHRGTCASWLQTTQRDLQNAQIYEAALQAARRGDPSAAACFVMAPWQLPGERSPYFAHWAESYAAHARALIVEGLRKGDWPVVVAASMPGRSEQGLTARARLSPQDEYLLARLAEHGASDPQERLQHGRQAQDLARVLGAGDVVALDRRAKHLFDNEFKRTSKRMQAVTDACAN